MWGSNKQVLHAKITNIISCTSRYYEEEKNWDDWDDWDHWDDWFNLLPTYKEKRYHRRLWREYNYKLKIIFISEGRIIETTILYSSEYGGLQIGDELCITTLKSDPNTILYVTRYDFSYKFNKFTLITLFVLIGILLLAMIGLFLPK